MASALIILAADPDVDFDKTDAISMASRLFPTPVVPQTMISGLRHINIVCPLVQVIQVAEYLFSGWKPDADLAVVLFIRHSTFKFIKGVLRNVLACLI